jgi:ZIP family zinc transporter
VRVSWIAIPLSLLTVVSTLIGGLTALRLREHLETVLALSGGVVVAVALFDVLPEAIDGIDNSRTVTTLVAAGFLTFFFFQRALVLHHRDDPDEARAHHRVGALGAAALSVHSFVDGLGIGLAFGVSNLTGVLVFVAVISHDFADGLNTVTFVLRQQGSRKRALRWLAADAAAPFFGAIVGTVVSVSAQNLSYLLAVYAGFFLYVGAADLLPAAHARTSPLRIALTLAGFAGTYAIVTIAAR